MWGWHSSGVATAGSWGTRASSRAPRSLQERWAGVGFVRSWWAAPGGQAAMSWFLAGWVYRCAVPAASPTSSTPAAALPSVLTFTTHSDVPAVAASSSASSRRCGGPIRAGRAAAWRKEQRDGAGDEDGIQPSLGIWYSLTSSISGCQLGAVWP